MNGAAGAVGISYADLSTERLETLKAMMDAVISAEAQFMTPILRSLFIIYLLIQFTQMWSGVLSVDRLVNSILRSGIIIFLVTHSGAFAQYIRDPLFDRIPRAISNTVLSSVGGGTTSSMGVAQQLDAVSLSIDHVTARILEMNTGWGITAGVNSIAAWANNGWAHTLLSWTAGVWICAASLLAISLCFGPLMLVFELFERTRGYLMQWVGTLVGLTAFGMGTSILLAIQMTQLGRVVRSLDRNLPTSSTEAVGAFGHVASGIALDLIALLALPAICAIGSGVAANHTAAATSIAMRGATGSAGAAFRAAQASARGGAGAGSRAANSINRA